MNEYVCEYVACSVCVGGVHVSVAASAIRGVGFPLSWSYRQSKLPRKGAKTQTWVLCKTSTRS